VANHTVRICEMDRTNPETPSDVIYKTKKVVNNEYKSNLRVLGDPKRSHLCV